jgi:hypothetical protein
MEARRGGVTITRLVLLVMLAIGIWAGSAPASGSAASSGLTVIQNSATSSFPQGIGFHLVAQNISEITSVRLAYRLGDEPITSVATVSFPPGFRIDLQHTIDLTRHFVPPGVTIHYQWQLQDQTGAELQTDWADVVVVDPRFLWHQRSLGGVTLNWYDGDDQFADAVLGAAARALAAAAQEQSATSVPPVQVFLYANQNDLRSSLGAGSEQWVGGETLPADHVVMLLASSANLVEAQRSIAHEMAHVALDSGDNPFGPLPTWLDEGLAMVAEGDPETTSVQALQAAVQSHHLLSILSISGNLPEATDQAVLAYAESDSIIRYFLQTYGNGKLHTLIGEFRQGATSDEAFQQAIGLSTVQFQQAWESSLAPSASRSAASTGGSPVLRTLSAPIELVAAIIQNVLQLLRVAKGQPA